MSFVCQLLLSLPAAQSADDVAVLHRPDAQRLEAYSASGQLLWTVAAPAQSLPVDLSPENAQGLLDGSWWRTAGGSWRLRSPRSTGSAGPASQGAAAPNGERRRSPCSASAPASTCRRT